MELAGKPNIESYFPIFDGIINEQVLKASLEVSKARNNLLNSFLNLVEEDNLDFFFFFDNQFGINLP
ncbi:hypothetical protein CFP56_002204 [Quercus suber]|uniref:Uncharacterized protein n=1 Tax=Quercus suber TaxID=58331 RepID=A0AAW0MAD1_QUESU